MKVKLRNPDRVVEVTGPRLVSALLKELDIVPESVLVIRDATLLTRDEALEDGDELEIRPVLSGGSSERVVPAEARSALPQRQGVDRFGTKGPTP
ncbi:MAG: MoaD/ThiS family protein [Actinomycetota bacterium]|nr:MoaD/ThiS family protein [Actinomycetota bacterium]